MLVFMMASNGKTSLLWSEHLETSSLEGSDLGRVREFFEKLKPHTRVGQGPGLLACVAEAGKQPPECTARFRRVSAAGPLGSSQPHMWEYVGDWNQAHLYLHATFFFFLARGSAVMVVGERPFSGAI